MLRILQIQIWRTVQYMHQIIIWVEGIFFCRFNNGVDNRARPCALRSVSEQPVFSSDDKGIYAALGTIIGNFQPAVK